MLAVRNEVGKSLRSMGVTAELKAARHPRRRPRKKERPANLSDRRRRLKWKPCSTKRENRKSNRKKWMLSGTRLQSQHANKADQFGSHSYEEARKMGLTPDQKK